jgi:hypothetical protein
MADVELASDGRITHASGFTLWLTGRVVELGYRRNGADA